MLCSDTGQVPVVRLEHLDVKTARRLNLVIGLLKRLFRGNGRLTLIMSGGRLDDVKITDASVDETHLK